MKLLIATGLYAPEIGGPATYTKMLEEDLPAHGFELTVVPFTVVRKFPKVIRHFVYGYKVWQASREVDVVYALDPVSVGLPAMLAARLRRKTFILRLGGDYAWEQGRVRFGLNNTLDEYSSEPKSAPYFVRILARLQTAVVGRAQLVIAPSEYLKRIILSWGIEDDRVQVINSTLLPLVTSTSKQTAREQFSSHSPVISTAGRLVPWKGMNLLLDVVNQLREQYPDILLVVCGDGPQRPVLEAKVAKYNLSKHVRFAGQASKAELADIIAGSDVFVLNTAYEGLSHQLLEVMDLGVPIVTTYAGGNAELLHDQVDALLVEFNNQEQLLEAIKTVVEHHETAERLVQFARARSKDFDRAKVMQELVQTLQNL